MKGRIQKIVANAGLCSRRKAEELIRAARVTVNGRPARIGDDADSSKDKILVDNKPLGSPRKVYILLNKPVGVETTLKSESGKPTVTQIVRCKERVIPAGRLDSDSCGLLILTNDGELAHRVMHPSYPLEKVYFVKIRGIVPDSKLDELRKGVKLEEATTLPCEVKLRSRGADTTKISITLHEGRKRQIRRMVESIGFQVLELMRTRIGDLTLRGLSEGRHRDMKPSELKKLKRTLKMID